MQAHDPQLLGTQLRIFERQLASAVVPHAPVPFAPGAAGAEQAVAPQPGAPKPEQKMIVYIGGAADEITTRFDFAINVADVFGIDTSVIADFDQGALIEKIVLGAPDVQGKWNVCSVIMAFAPNLYAKSANAKKALAQTSIEDYPSRKEVHMKHYNVS